MRERILLDGDNGLVALKVPTRLVGSEKARAQVAVYPGASGSVLEGFTATFPITALTGSAHTAIKLAGKAASPVKDVTIRGVTSFIGNAPEGQVRAQHNFAGFPMGRCITLDYVDGVLIEECDLSRAFKGIVGSGNDITIRRCDIYRVRTSPIVMTSVTGFSVLENTLREAFPWGWGDTANDGDHGDYVHIFHAASTVTCRDITISRNLMHQGRGVAILGPYLDDNGTGKGFDNVVIEGNVIRNGNLQGVRLENVRSGRVVSNFFIPPPGCGPKQWPQPVLYKCGDVIVADNFCVVEQEAGRIEALRGPLNTAAH